MNKIYISAISLLISSVIHAQDSSLFDKFSRDISSFCTELAYSYTTRISGINGNGQGTLCFQDVMWRMEGNGVQMYCDSETTWVVDSSTKEVVIEPVTSDPSESLLTNPALIVAMADSFFEVKESLCSDDRKAMIYALRPKSESSIDFLNLEILKADAKLRRAWIAFDDGTSIKIEVSSMKLTPKVSVKAFRPETIFDSEWIITDLR